MKYTNTHDNQSVTVTRKDGKVVRLAPGKSVDVIPLSVGVVPKSKGSKKQSKKEEIEEEQE